MNYDFIFFIYSKEHYEGSFVKYSSTVVLDLYSVFVFLIFQIFLVALFTNIFFFICILKNKFMCIDKQTTDDQNFYFFSLN